MLSAAFKQLRYQLFAATWLSYAGFYVTRKVFSVVKGPVRDALGVGDVEVSWLFTAYLVAYMLGQFSAAGLSRRLSNRRLLLIGMGVSIACNLAMGVALSWGRAGYLPIVGLMAVHGLAQATGWPANVGLMANWTGRTERGTVMAFWGTCYQLGAVAGKAFAAFVFGWLGLVWSFWGTSLVLAAVWGLFYFWGRESPEAAGQPALDEEPPPNPDAPRGAAGTTTPRQMALLIVAMGVIYFAFKAVRYALDSWSALLMAEQFALTTAQSGYLSATFDWVGFLGVLAAGPVSDRWFKGSRTPVIALMTFGCFAATLAMWAVGMTSLTSFVALLGLIGFLEMGPDSLLSGAGAIDAGSRRHAALAAGVINGCGSIGPIVQEPMIAWLKTHAGVDAVLLVPVVMMAAASLGTAALWLTVRRRGIRL